MNKSDLEFDVVSAEQQNLQSLVVFEVNRTTSMVRKTNVGQFISSSPFELNFPATIGKSKWNLILFLNGQYEDGQPDGMINIYLKLVHCEHQSAEFKFDITFQLAYGRAKITNKNQRICFANAKSRWIRAKLIDINELIVNGRRYIRDDILALSAQLDENLPSMDNYSNYSLPAESYVNSENKMMDSPYVSVEEASYNNNFWNNKEQCDKSEKIPTDSSQHSKEHVSWKETAYNLWVKNVQCDKSEKMTIDTAEHSKEYGTSTTTYNHNSSFKEKPIVTAETMTHYMPGYSKNHGAWVGSSYDKEESYDTTTKTTNNLPHYSSKPCTMQSDNIFRDNELQNSLTGGSASTKGPDSVYARNLICDSNLNYVENEYSDEEDAERKSSHSNNSIAARVKHFFGQLTNPK